MIDNLGIIAGFNNVEPIIKPMNPERVEKLTDRNLDSMQLEDFDFVFEEPMVK
jgi:hypothetical protein